MAQIKTRGHKFMTHPDRAKARSLLKGKLEETCLLPGGQNSEKERMQRRISK